MKKELSPDTVQYVTLLLAHGLPKSEMPIRIAAFERMTPDVQKLQLAILMAILKR